MKIIAKELRISAVPKMVGDSTAERQGRLSLNPLAHFDLVGTLMLLFVGFGWAKPVPINTRYFRHPRRDILIVSLAGVAGNLLTAAYFGCEPFDEAFGKYSFYQYGPNVNLQWHKSFSAP